MIQKLKNENSLNKHDLELRKWDIQLHQVIHCEPQRTKAIWTVQAINKLLGSKFSKILSSTLWLIMDSHQNLQVINSEPLNINLSCLL